MEIINIVVYAAAVIIVLGLLYLVWHYTSRTNKLRRKLAGISLIIDKEDLELLKGDYIEIYHLYLKLSEKKKQNFYSRIMELREKIEGQIKAKKKIKGLFERVDEGSLHERKRKYLEVHKHYQTLPEKSREKYYAPMVRLRDKLERGT